MVDVSQPSTTAADEARPLPDFSNVEETFRHLSDGELRQTRWLFSLMGSQWLTERLSGLSAWAVRWRIPGATWGVKRTIYRQFVGGTGLDDALPRIERLHRRGVTSILDFGSEAKSSEEDFERFKDEVLRAIDFCAGTTAANSVVVKITGLAPDEVLEKYNSWGEFDAEDAEDPRMEELHGRLDAIASRAAEKGVQLYVDAEESWFQNTIDRLADVLMERYNRGKVVVLNTFQLYRHDRLAFLRASDERARSKGYLLGAKLVRGAYMVKESERAMAKGEPSPIQPDIESTHRDFDAALRYCVERHERICTTIGSHNEASTRLGCELIAELGIPRDHPHVGFAQLLGMSDNLTFNLAAGGYNVAKYMVYGPVTDVLPYLVRRAQENTSVTGEMGRELRLLESERDRRKAAR